MFSSRIYILSISIAISFFSLTNSGCSGEKDLYKQVPFNRITLIKNDTLIQFYTKPPADKLPSNFPEDKYYTWYSADSILVTKGSYSGKLLHGDYIELYPNRALKQKGKYLYGAKNGNWESWYQNGERESIIVWKNGVKDGIEKLYSRDGTIQQMKYKQGEILSDSVINKM